MLIRFFRIIPIAFVQFLQFLLIVMIVGSVFFVIGELLPRKNFDYTSFPYRSYKWEKNGDIYRRLHIQKWKDHVPDMSKYVKTMFAKEIVSPRDPKYTHRLILETCVAELIHVILILVSPIFLNYLDGIYGYIGMILYALGNLPFILIQRYNRPRLIQLMNKQLAAITRAKEKKEDNLCSSH